MANTDTPSGLRPLRHRNGAPYNGACNPYYVASGYATALFIGDPVALTGTANTAAVEDYPIAALPEVDRLDATAEYAIGVIVGVGPNRDNLSLTYSPASTANIVWVADDPDLIFEVQEDDTDGDALAAVDVSLNADMVYTHAGSTVTGISGAELDRSTKAATATLPLRLLRFANRPDNELGASAYWEVMFNLHAQRYTTGL